MVLNPSLDSLYNIRRKGDRKEEVELFFQLHFFFPMVSYNDLNKILSTIYLLFLLNGRCLR